MTIIQLNDAIKDIALNHYAIKQYHYGNVYSINDLADIRYGLLNYHVDTITQINDDTYRVAGVMIYLDRILENESNLLQVQSDGIVYLSEMFNRLSDKYLIDFDSVIYTPTSEKFNDNCGVVFVSFNTTIMNSTGTCESL